MANTFSSDLLYKVLASAVGVLRERLGLARIVDKDFGPEPADRGYSKTYPVPQQLEASAITPSATPPSLVDITPRSVTIVASNFYGARFHLTEKDLQMIRSSNDYVPQQVEEAAAAVARAIEDSLWTLYYRFFEEVGAIGDAIFGGSTPTTNAVAEAAARLNKWGVPEVGRYLVIGHDEEEAGLKNAELKNAAYYGQGMNQLRASTLRPLFGFEPVVSARRTSHTYGSVSSVTVSGAHNAGSTTIALAVGGGGSCDIKAGDIITFGTDPQQYSAQAARSGAGNLLIEPPLVSSVANGTTVAVRGTGSSYNVNLALQRSAIKLLMRQPLLPEIDPAVSILRYTDPETGIPMALHKIPGYWSTQFEIAALWGCGVVDPRRGVRISG